MNVILAGLLSGMRNAEESKPAIQVEDDADNCDEEDDEQQNSKHIRPLCSSNSRKRKGWCKRLAYLFCIICWSLSASVLIKFGAISRKLNEVAILQ